MKKHYTLSVFAAALLVVGTTASAQVFTACNDPEGGIQIRYDYALNCEDSPGSLADLDSIGFHSGANGWAAVVEWDAPNATTGKPYADQKYVVKLPSPNTYYGTAVQTINFVFNQGATKPDVAWEAEGKAQGANNECEDFFLDLLTITETCSAIPTGIADAFALDKVVSLSPNPATGYTSIAFDNTEGESYRVQLHDALGQLVHDVPNFSGERLEVALDGQPAGLYTVTLRNSAGKFEARRLLVE